MILNMLSYREAGIIIYQILVRFRHSLFKCKLTQFNKLKQLYGWNIESHF